MTLEDSATLWTGRYIEAHGRALRSIPPKKIAELVGVLRAALDADRQIFAFGNGGSAANASHFATDLGKGASDKIGRRFRVMSLNDNVPWLTALGNDYAYEDIFVRQLQTYARSGDIALGMSVSGASPNIVKALRWARDNGLVTIALAGSRPGGIRDIAQHVIVIDDAHYGRVEDAHMTICHLLCYAFMESSS
ncbi:MAG TPA: SIS domain-containing protein [Verrucomicrobiae bacterium]|nr:SIS domain-containing protein [Verrucomicrobiae bacterium]